MLEEVQLEDIKEILGALYVKHGLTDEVVRLSQWVDTMVVKSQKQRQVEYAKIS